MPNISCRIPQGCYFLLSHISLLDKAEIILDLSHLRLPLSSPFYKRSLCFFMQTNQTRLRTEHDFRPLLYVFFFFFFGCKHFRLNVRVCVTENRREKQSKGCNAHGLSLSRSVCKLVIFLQMLYCFFFFFLLCI